MHAQDKIGYTYYCCAQSLPLNCRVKNNKFQFNMEFSNQKKKYEKIKQKKKT